MTERSFIFAGGGTGGHIYPALAIAEEIERAHPGARCVFVCSDRAIDAAVLERTGAPYTVIPARPFGLKPRTAARLVWRWGACVRAGRRLIRAERKAGFEPIVVTTGGFVGPPMAQAARAARAAVALVNLDAAPGLANRRIGRRAQAAFTTYAVADRPAWEVIAPIVREGARPAADAGRCRVELRLDPQAPTLAVLGGSQGAGTINQAMIEIARGASASLEPWQIIHQSGEREISSIRAAYKKAGVRAIVEPFFDPIGAVWGAADLVVTRAGAGTVAEAWASGTPAVFLPYPFHHDSHQRLNAAPMVDAGAGIALPDRVDPVENARVLAAALSDLRPDGAMLGRMRNAAADLGPTDGAPAVARALAG